MQQTSCCVHVPPHKHTPYAHKYTLLYLSFSIPSLYFFVHFSFLLARVFCISDAEQKQHLGGSAHSFNACCRVLRLPQGPTHSRHQQHTPPLVRTRLPSSFSLVCSHFSLSLVQRLLSCAALASSTTPVLVPEHASQTHTTTTKSSILLQWFRVLFALSHRRLPSFVLSSSSCPISPLRRHPRPVP
jgi:hypothetical protein